MFGGFMIQPKKVSAVLLSFIFAGTIPGPAAYQVLAQTYRGSTTGKTYTGGQVRTQISPITTISFGNIKSPNLNLGKPLSLNQAVKISQNLQKTAVAITKPSSPEKTSAALKKTFDQASKGTSSNLEPAGKIAPAPNRTSLLIKNNPSVSTKVARPVVSSPKKPRSTSFLKRVALIFFTTLSLLLPSFSAFAPKADAMYVRQYFGQNKVKYDVHDYKILKTPHFDIYYYPEEEEAVKQAGRMAEEAYAEFSQVLNHEYKKPRPIIPYASRGDFEQTNTMPFQVSEGVGAFTDFFLQRIVIPFEGNMARFKHVLRHEMVHQFQFDIAAPKLSQKMNLMRSNLPLWFFEGMAERVAMGKVDVHTEMWLREAAIENFLPSMRQLAYMPDYRAYRFGQSFWDFIIEQYGESAVVEIYKRAAGPSLADAIGDPTENLNPIFRGVTGKSLDQLSTEWFNSIRRKYYPQIVNHKTADEVGRYLLPIQDDWLYGPRIKLGIAPALSPDGKKVAYISGGSDMTLSLYMASADNGGNTARLVRSGQTVSFESLRSIDASVAWAPNNKDIAFTALSEGEPVLYIMDTDQKKVTKNIRLDLDEVMHPSWSPDGQQIVFTGLKGAQSNLYTVNRDGTGLKALTQDFYSDLQPVWSQDGKKIAFVTDRGPGTNLEKLTFNDLQIAIYDLESGQISLLPNQKGKNISPQWSQDGSQIAFISDRTGISNIYVQNLKDNQIYQVTDVLTGVTGITEDSPALSWASGSDRMVFSLFTKGGVTLKAMDRVSSEMKPFQEVQPQTPVPDSSIVKILPVVDSLQIVNPDSLMGTGFYVFRPSGYSPNSSSRDSTATDTTASIPDTSQFKTVPYKANLRPNFIALSGTSFATNSGVYQAMFVSLSDMLGDKNLLAAMYGTNPLTDDIYAEYTNQRRRAKWGASLFRLRNVPFFYSFEGPRGPGGGLANRSYTVGEFFLHYPKNKFERFEFEISNILETRKYPPLITEDKTVIPYPADRRLSIAPNISYVKDNTIWGPWGPHRGTRGRIEFRQSLLDRQFTQGTVDWRNYKNLGTDFILASRVVLSTIQGRDKMLYYLGGPYTIRGYPYGSVVGNSIAMANLEMRTPFIDLVLMRLPLLGRMATMARGVVFVDAAYTRSPEFIAELVEDSKFYHTQEVVASFGFGWRMPFLGVLWGFDKSWRILEGGGAFQVSIFPGF
ncbi:MAG: PD40 domain-containing protein [Elusimicrobia bacterium]|nr:PD40 domain-containing protein [Elusimicrobiota bacterium]